MLQAVMVLAKNRLTWPIGETRGRRNSGTLLTRLTFLTLNFFHILFWQLSAKMCSFITCPLIDDRFFNNFIFFNYLK